MKILLVTPMPPAPQAPGAIPLVLHAQLTGLTQRHEVTLVTVAGPDPAEWAAVERLRAKGLEVYAVHRTEPQGLARWRRRWRFASTWLSGRYPWRTVWFWEPEVQEILDRLLAGRSFDIVQAEDNATGIYRFNTRLPVVLTEHEVRRPRPIRWSTLAHPPRMARALGEADWQRWGSYQRRVWSRFARVQVFTTRDAAMVGAIAPELAARVRVNPFGIELPAQLPPREERSDSLLFVGNFTHPPNVDAALWLGEEIMPLMRRRRSGVRLTLVGPEPPPRLRSLACDDIVVTGRVPAIEPFLHEASVVLAPIRTGGGQRMKVLQSMALGKAVVTTPRGAEGLKVDGFALPLIIAEGAAALAESTLALLSDATARAELGCLAYSFVAEHYSPEAYARRQEAIYGELIMGVTSKGRQR